MNRPLPRGRSIRFTFASVLLMIACLWSGCQNPPTLSSESVPSDDLVVGMRAESVEAKLGAPASVTPGTGNNYVEETWVYKIEHPPVYRTIVAEMQDVPWMDPITGEMKTLLEPVTDQQRLDRSETITLVFRYDQLMSINREVDEQRAFSR